MTIWSNRDGRGGGEVTPAWSKPKLPDGDSSVIHEAIDEISGDVGSGDRRAGLSEALRSMMLGDDDYAQKADDTPVEQSEDGTHERLKALARIYFLSNRPVPGNQSLLHLCQTLQ